MSKKKRNEVRIAFLAVCYFMAALISVPVLCHYIIRVTEGRFRNASYVITVVVFAIVIFWAFKSLTVLKDRLCLKSISILCYGTFTAMMFTALEINAVGDISMSPELTKFWIFLAILMCMLLYGVAQRFYDHLKDDDKKVKNFLNALDRMESK